MHDLKKNIWRQIKTTNSLWPYQGEITPATLLQSAQEDCRVIRNMPAGETASDSQHWHRWCNTIPAVVTQRPEKIKEPTVGSAGAGLTQSKRRQTLTTSTEAWTDWVLNLLKTEGRRRLKSDIHSSAAIWSDLEWRSGRLVPSSFSLLERSDWTKRGTDASARSVSKG